MVEVISNRWNSPEDPKDDCRSFGGNYFLSSHSRKMSIGIMVDSATRKQPEATNKSQVPGPNAEMKNSVKENYAVAKLHDRSVGDLNKGKQAEAPQNASSPWISPRSLRGETLNKETEISSHLPSTKGRNSKLNGKKGANIEHTVHFFSNQVTTSGNSKEKSKGSGAKGKTGDDGNTTAREDDFTFAIAHDGLASSKVVTGDKTEEKTETLRVKLWEILGTVASPKTQPSDSHARDMGLNTSEPIFEKDDAVVKPRELPDTIETDSESIDHMLKRPITRSLARKKPSTGKPPGKSKSGRSNTCNHKFEEKNNPCRGRLSGKGNITVDGGFSMSGKKVQRKRSSVKPRKIIFSEKKNVDNLPQETHRAETSASAAKRSLADNQTGCFSGFAAQKKRDSTSSKEQNQERDSTVAFGRNSQQSIGTPKKDQQGADYSPHVLADHDQPEDTAYLSQSPTLKMNTLISCSSPCSALKRKQENQDACIPEDAQRIPSASNFRSFRSLQKFKGNTSSTTNQVESLDDAADPKDSPPNKMASLQEQDVETCLSESSAEDEDSDGSEDGSPIIEVNLHGRLSSAKKQKDAEATFSAPSDANEDSDNSRESSPNTDEFGGIDIPIPEAAPAKRSRFMHSPKIRNREQKQNNVDVFSLPLPSREGPAGSDWMPSPEPSISTLNDDSQSKMALATKRKSSEILTSVSEEIHQQLQEIESDIHTDLGKLTSVARSKRKRLEGKFQEQQDQLKLMHEKFKADIHRHLQESKNMLEGLEVQQHELKGAMKNQKASHQKLLLRAEEAIQTKLSDAERRITGVQKSAKEKMLLVYRALAECLNEGGPS